MIDSSGVKQKSNARIALGKSSLAPFHRTSGQNLLNSLISPLTWLYFPNLCKMPTKMLTPKCFHTLPVHQCLSFLNDELIFPFPFPFPSSLVCLLYFPPSQLSPSFTSINPDTLSHSNPAKLQNLVNGEWQNTKEFEHIPDPMNAPDVIVHAPATSSEELRPFIDSMLRVPKTGLHNPLKNVDRYVMLGEVSHKAAVMLGQEIHFFARCIQRVMPKSYAQAVAEVKVTQQFLKVRRISSFLLSSIRSYILSIPLHLYMGQSFNRSHFGYFFYSPVISEF
jgi:hypothetical protein